MIRPRHHPQNPKPPGVKDEWRRRRRQTRQTAAALGGDPPGIRAVPDPDRDVRGLQGPVHDADQAISHRVQVDGALQARREGVDGSLGVVAGSGRFRERYGRTSRRPAAFASRTAVRIPQLISRPVIHMGGTVLHSRSAVPARLGPAGVHSPRAISRPSSTGWPPLRTWRSTTCRR